MEKFGKVRYALLLNRAQGEEKEKDKESTHKGTGFVHFVNK